MSLATLPDRASIERLVRSILEQKMSPNGKPSANVIVYLSPGSNATETSEKVQAFVAQAKKTFPAGIDYVIPYDSTMFVRAAIKDVLITLFEAIGLVAMRTVGRRKAPTAVIRSVTVEIDPIRIQIC